MGLFNLEEQFSFYGAYHNNRINQWVHIICVPLLVWSTMVWLSNWGEVIDLPWVAKLPDYRGWVPCANPAFLVGASYLLYYLILEPFAAITYAPILLLEFVIAGWFAAQVPDHNWYALAVHVTSWVLQIGAHHVFEGRSPALLDSFAQAFMMAPLFVWMEVLFMLGYRPGLQSRLRSRIGKAITQHRRTQAQKLKKKE